MGMLLVPIFVGKIIENTSAKVIEGVDSSVKAAVNAEYLFIGLAVVAITVSIILNRSSKNNPQLGLDVPNKSK
jgi:predicted Na+-dependent transporter